MKILVADDDDDVREMVRELFEVEGFEVSTARDGVEALEKLDSAKHCAVILDLLMPIMDGHELYRRLQADAGLAAPAIFILTSVPSRAPAGATVLAKPFDANHLVALVRHACRRTTD